MLFCLNYILFVFKFINFCESLCNLWLVSISVLSFFNFDGIELDIWEIWFLDKLRIVRLLR